MVRSRQEEWMVLDEEPIIDRLSERHQFHGGTATAIQFGPLPDRSFRPSARLEFGNRETLSLIEFRSQGEFLRHRADHDRHAIGKQGRHHRAIAHQHQQAERIEFMPAGVGLPVARHRGDPSCIPRHTDYRPRPTIRSGHIVIAGRIRYGISCGAMAKSGAIALPETGHDAR